jgi:hypothetical protein
MILCGLPCKRPFQNPSNFFFNKNCMHCMHRYALVRTLPQPKLPPPFFPKTRLRVCACEKRNRVN